MKALDFQAKQITYNVYTYFKKKKADTKTVEFKNDINLIDTVSAVTGLSKSSVARIIREGNSLKMKRDDVVVFKPPTDKKKMVRKKRIEVDARTESIIRKKVIQFYTMKNEVPGVRTLNTLLKEENILNCSNEYLRQLLYKLGFTNAEQNSKGMLRERADIISERMQYLQAIKKYREEGRAIFYFNDVKRWKIDDEALWNPEEMPSLVITIGSDVPFLDNSIILLKEKENNSKKSAHVTNFNWVKNTFLANIPVSSVVVMNYSYCETAESAVNAEKPSMASTRTEMEEWLKRHKIPFKETDTKADLCAEISNQEKRLKYSIDRIIKEGGHNILYLPQNHNDLNPATVLWEDLKNYATEAAPKALLLNKCSKEKWDKCFKEVKESENEYYNHDTKVDDSEHLSKLKTIKEEVADYDSDSMDCE